MKPNPGPERKKERSGGYLFLALVLALYLLSFFPAPQQTWQALQFSAVMLKKLAPVLVVVCLLMFVTNLVVKPQWVKKHVGRDSGFKGVLIAILGGILSLGPIYVWYEILNDLQHKGMRKSLVASFLYARSVKPQLLPLMIFYFGWLYALLLTAYLILFSFLNGRLTERLLGEDRQ